MLVLLPEMEVIFLGALGASRIHHSKPDNQLVTLEEGVVFERCGGG